MTVTIQIRNEKPADYRQVEAMTQRAFWNLYTPGCVEHYVAHQIRSHPDFIPELDFVLLAGQQIIGNVMYTRAHLIAENGQTKPCLTFGPICISPEFQRQGFGKRLLQHSFAAAKALGEDSIVIFGDPTNYVTSGLKSCLKFRVSLPNGSYPAAMLVKELTAGALAGHHWQYQGSPAYDIDVEKAQQFNAVGASLPKKTQPSQEAFYIISHATVTP